MSDEADVFEPATEAEREFHERLDEGVPYAEALAEDLPGVDPEDVGRGRLDDIEDRPETYREALDRALDAYGIEAQRMMAVEECAELMTALAQHRRGRVDEQAVVEEIADVEIMLDQMALAFGNRDVIEAKERKIDRLKDRLAGADS